MALIDIYNAKYDEDSDFRKQVAGACFIAAMDIINESPSTNNHANRIIWANKTINNPKGAATAMLSSVLTNATIRATLPEPVDNDVQFVVNSFIDTYAVGE